MNVLVVDNEIVQLENLRIGLSERGYHVLQAQSGHEALNLIETEVLEIDLVITDYEMPEMNGIELLQNIRWKQGNLPVILMSAYGQKPIPISSGETPKPVRTWSGTERKNPAWHSHAGDSRRYQLDDCQ